MDFQEFKSSPWYPVLALSNITRATYSPNPQGTENGWIEQWVGPDLPAGVLPPGDQSFPQGVGELVIPINPGLAGTNDLSLWLLGFAVSMTGSDNTTNSPTNFVFEVLNRSNAVIADYTQSFTVTAAAQNSGFLFRPGRVMKAANFAQNGNLTLTSQAIYTAVALELANPDALVATDAVTPVACRFRVTTNITGRTYTVTPYIATDGSFPEFLEETVMPNYRNLNVPSTTAA